MRISNTPFFVEGEGSPASKEELLSDVDKLTISRPTKEAVSEVLVKILAIKPFDFTSNPFGMEINHLGHVRYSFSRPKDILQLLQASELLIDDRNYPEGKPETKAAREIMALDALGAIPNPSEEQRSAESMSQLALFLNRFFIYYYQENGGNTRHRIYTAKRVFQVPEEHMSKVLEKSLMAIQTSFVSNLIANSV